MQSISIKQETACPYCGRKNTYTLWNLININQAPFLRSNIIDDEINVITCYGCNRVISCRASYVYDDPKHEFAVLYIPADKVYSFRSITEKKPGLFYSKLRIVLSHCRLLEKIRINQSGLNDMAIEIGKLINFSDSYDDNFSYAYSHKDNDFLYFTKIDEDRLKFMETKLYKMPMAVYDSVLTEEKYNTSPVAGKWKIVDEIYAIGELYGKESKAKLISIYEEEYRLKLLDFWA